jgi:crotonobetaine/carnitine-CoA ligase
MSDTRTLGGLLHATAELRGNSTFVHFDGVDLSYAELDFRASRVAHGFARLGVRPGDRVAIALPNGIDFLVAWFGLARLGAIEVPVNLEFRPREVLYVLDDAQAGVLVTDEAFTRRMGDTLRSAQDLHSVVIAGPVSVERADISPLRLMGLDELLARDASHAELSDVHAGDTTAILYTSGTTGHPKGVMLCHEHQISLGENIAASLSLGEADCFYNFFPLYHNTAQGIITCAVLVAEARMLLVGRFSRSRFWSDVKAHGCTRFYGMGSIVEILNQDPRGVAAAQGHTLRTCWGIAISAGQSRRFAELFGVEFVTGYGATEANMVAMTSDQSLHPGSAGPVVARDFEVRIVDENDCEVAPGTVGEIVVRPRRPYVTSLGYWNRPDATVESWRNLWLHTGDAGRFDDQGRLYFVDRIKDVIRSRGNSVASAQVESVILAMEQVAEVAVIAGPSDLGELDQDVYALIVPVAGRAVDPAEVVAHCARHLAHYAVPRYVEVVDELPKTPTEKVRKNELRARGLGPAAWDRKIAGVDVRAQHANAVPEDV